MLYKTIFCKISPILSKDLWEMNLFQSQTILFAFETWKVPYQLLPSWSNSIRVSSLTFQMENVSS